MRIPLLGGAYSARSRIAACTRSINYFPEKNPEGAAIIPMTQYQSPGLVPLAQDVDNKKPVRQVYRASNGDGYCVIGQTVYYVSPAWVLTGLGQLTAAGINTVYLIDNGNDILLVDGSATGYTINLTTRAFAPLVDPDGFFQAGGSCDTVDEFVLWSVPGTRIFKSTLNNQLVPFDDTYFASKSAYPDFLQRLIINRLQIILLGTLKSEIWYDVGGAQFPFARIPGTYIEHGTVAPASAAASDISVFWLSQSLRGVGYVHRQRGYDTKVISNYALSYAIGQMAKAGTIADAIGFTYTIEGHEFYVLTFPSGNQTWVFDDSIGDPELAWHQWCFTDLNGNLNRSRVNCGAFLYGKNVIGDWGNGTLYALDNDAYTDTVDGVVYARSFIRTFPHISLSQLDLPNLPALGHTVNFKNFMLDVESGGGQGQPPDPLTGFQTPDKIGLRWSVDRGKTWGQTVLQSNGNPGQYITQPKWGTAGLARDMIFEINHSIAGPVALNGAWVDASIAGN